MPASWDNLEALAKASQQSDRHNKRLVTCVLAKWSDGLYYKVDRVKECNKAKKQCLIVFEDQVETWTQVSDVHVQLEFEALGDDNNIVCCVCGDGQSVAPNEIVMCDACQQGYHIDCHEPKVDRAQVHLEDDLVEWTCSTCEYISSQLKKLKVKTPRKSSPSSARSSPKPSAPKSASKLSRRSALAPKALANNCSPEDKSIKSEGSAEGAESIMPTGKLMEIIERE